jgi:hypothetical protein
MALSARLVAVPVDVAKEQVVLRPETCPPESGLAAPLGRLVEAAHFRAAQVLAQSDDPRPRSSLVEALASHLAPLLRGQQEPVWFVAEEDGQAQLPRLASSFRSRWKS